MLMLICPEPLGDQNIVYVRKWSIFSVGASGYSYVPRFKQATSMRIQ